MFCRGNRRQGAPPVEVAPPRAATTPVPPAPNAVTATSGDILITLSSQEHLRRVIADRERFLGLILRRKANRARSRQKLKGLANALNA